MIGCELVNYTSAQLVQAVLVSECSGKPAVVLIDEGNTNIKIPNKP